MSISPIGHVEIRPCLYQKEYVNRWRGREWKGRKRGKRGGENRNGNIEKILLKEEGGGM